MVFYCPKCNLEATRKSGKIRVEKATRTNLQNFYFQAYRCMNNHLFIPNHNQSSFTNSFIEFVVILYLRSLSLNTVIQIVRVQFEKDILSKETILEFIEKVSDLLPDLSGTDDEVASLVFKIWGACITTCKQIDVRRKIRPKDREKTFTTILDPYGRGDNIFLQGMETAVSYYKLKKEKYSLRGAPKDSPVRIRK